MQSYFRNALLTVAALAALAFTPQKALAQGEGAVTITVAEPTEFAGQVLAPGAYLLRKPFGEWYLTLEESSTHRRIGFVRYQSVLERQGVEAQLTTAALDDQAPAKVAITSVYIPATGREYLFGRPERTTSQPAATDSAGK
jgi:hypothetical protein